MPDQVTTIFKQMTGWPRLKAFIGLLLVALTGCFGPPTMHYDIQEYNKQVVSSEQEMLLYNIGRLNRNLPPHFMMVSSVSQTRMFSGSASFQWGQMWNNLFLPQKHGGMTPKGADTYVAGLAAGTVENPTITFVPIQGQDFANRFETPLRDTFSYFLEDREWYATDAEEEAIVLLFAQSLYLKHGDDSRCKRGNGLNGLFVNRLPNPLRLNRPGTQYYSELEACVQEIVEQYSDTEQVDSGYPVPTKASTDPLATDAVSALSSNLEWIPKGDKFGLIKPVRIPAWFDYSPNFVKPPESNPKSDETPPQVWSQTQEPKWQDTGYFMPKGYSWKVYRDRNNQRVYALVPDGYDLARDQKGKLKEDENGNYIAKKTRDVAHSASGRWTRDSTTIIGTRKIDADDVGSSIVGTGIPPDTRILAVDATKGTARMSRKAYDGSDKIQVSPHDVTGTMTKDRQTITYIDGISPRDVGSPIAGPGIPTGTTIVAVDTTAKTATMSQSAYGGSTTTIRVGLHGLHSATGTTIKGSRIITAIEGISRDDERSPIAGPGIPPETTIETVDPVAKTATMSHSATDNLSIGDVALSDQFSYADDVVKEVWPTPQDYFYLELRKGEVDDLTAKGLCFGPKPRDNDIDQSGLVCGYFKIGNLLQIMQRLADMACTPEAGANGSCEPSIFGVGPEENIPPWADSSAPFTYNENGSGVKQWVWVPAHDPQEDPVRAERDRRMFFTLYKLYQMSLVSTSALVAGAPPVTISK